jgi:hypothetical protein
MSASICVKRIRFSRPEDALPFLRKSSIKGTRICAGQGTRSRFQDGNVHDQIAEREIEDCRKGVSSQQRAFEDVKASCRNGYFDEIANEDGSAAKSRYRAKEDQRAGSRERQMSEYDLDGGTRQRRSTRADATKRSPRDSDNTSRPRTDIGSRVRNDSGHGTDEL